MSNNSSSEYKRIYDIADDYKKRGYKVTIEPTPEQLPEFLKDYRPDILAEGTDESVVVEVKLSDKGRVTDYWGSLANVIKQHPGWRLELIVTNKMKPAPLKTLPPEQVNKLLKEGQSLAQERMLDASLLITWSAVEAAMRLAGESNEVDLPDFRPTTVISRLYTDGVLDREEYEFLLDCVRKRNAVAHGFRREAIKPSFITRLRKIAERLLENRSDLVETAT